jgi:hypothetical protein
MSDFDVQINVKEISRDAVVFASIGDLIKCFNELENGKYVIVTYVNGAVNPPIKVSELLTPSEIVAVKDGKMRFRVEETSKAAK